MKLSTAAVSTFLLPQFLVIESRIHQDSNKKDDDLSWLMLDTNANANSKGNSNSGRALLLENKVQQQQQQLKRRLQNRASSSMEKAMKNGPSYQRRNRRHLQQDNEEEPQECAPYLGILACAGGGPHEYCVPNLKSRMGGFCVDFSSSGNHDGASSRIFTRRVQEEEQVEQDDGDEPIPPEQQVNEICHCYPNYPYHPYVPAKSYWEWVERSYCQTPPRNNYNHNNNNNTYYYGPSRNCECTNVDEEAYTLTVDCSYDGSQNCWNGTWSQCNVYLPDVTVCGSSYTRHIEITGDRMVTRKDCSNNNGMETCNTRNFQSQWNGTYGYSSSTLEEATCEREVNGVVCNSCDYQQQNITSCYTYNDVESCNNWTYTCQVYDCSNSDWDFVKETCDMYHSPPPPPHYLEGCELNCNICGDDGATVTLPDAEFDIPFYGKSQCGNAQQRATQGALTPEGCDAIQLLAQVPCGCQAEVKTSKKKKGVRASAVFDPDGP